MIDNALTLLALLGNGIGCGSPTPRRSLGASRSTMHLSQTVEHVTNQLAQSTGRTGNA